MRITLALDDHLLLAATRRARERGQTLGQLVEDALRRELSTTSAGTPAAVPVLRGRTGIRPGVDATSNGSLHEALDCNRDLPALR